MILDTISPFHHHRYHNRWRSHQHIWHSWSIDSLCKTPILASYPQFSSQIQNAYNETLQFQTFYMNITLFHLMNRNITLFPFQDENIASTYTFSYSSTFLLHYLFYYSILPPQLFPKSLEIIYCINLCSIFLSWLYEACSCRLTLPPIKICFNIQPQHARYSIIDRI